MKMLVGLGIVGSLVAVSGPVQAQPDAERSQIMCDLTGDCAGSAPESVSAPEPAAAHGEPRSSATRGFTFKRATGSEAATPAPAPVAVPAKRTARAVDLRVVFPPNSATLTGEAQARLRNVAAVLVSPALAGRRLRIEGHTDSSGSATANLDLSRRRAQSVAAFLIASGVEKTRLDIVGYGSTRPLPDTAPQAAQNRRVMAVLL